MKQDKYLQNFIKYDIALDCFYCSLQKEEFLEYLEIVFFEKKNRLFLYGNMKSGSYLLFEDDPGTESLFNKIKKEVHRQRAEVIEYLKEEGDWDPAWDEKLGLD